MPWWQWHYTCGVFMADVRRRQYRWPTPLDDGNLSLTAVDRHHSPTSHYSIRTSHWDTTLSKYTSGTTVLLLRPEPREQKLSKVVIIEFRFLLIRGKTHQNYYSYDQHCRRGGLWPTATSGMILSDSNPHRKFPAMGSNNAVSDTNNIPARDANGETDTYNMLHIVMWWR